MTAWSHRRGYRFPTCWYHCSRIVLKPPGLRPGCAPGLPFLTAGCSWFAPTQPYRPVGTVRMVLSSLRFLSSPPAGLVPCQGRAVSLRIAGGFDKVAAALRAGSTQHPRAGQVYHRSPFCGAVALQVQIGYNALGLQGHLRGLAADARHAPLGDLHLAHGLECRVEERIKC